MVSLRGNVKKKNEQPLVDMSLVDVFGYTVFSLCVFWC